MNEIARQTSNKNLKRGNPAWGRKEDGTGKSGNPQGPPRHADCLLDCIKEELGKISLNGINTNEQLIAAVLVGGASRGNMNATRLLMEYLHAKPTSSMELSSKEGKPLQSFVFQMPDGTTLTPKQLLNE